MVDRRCRGSEGKAKIEGYMSVSDEEAPHCSESNTHGYLVFSYTKCILISEQIVTIQQAQHLMTPTSSLNFPKQPPEDLP